MLFQNCEGKALQDGEMDWIYKQAELKAKKLFDELLIAYPSGLELIQNEREATENAFKSEKRRYVDNNVRNKVHQKYEFKRF